MKIPFLDLKRNYSSIKGEILNEISEVLESAHYVLGPKVVEFEKAFALAHESQFCYGTSSGTDANHMALWALEVGPGDEVILPANTFIATAWGITLCGAKPVFVDCESDSYNINANLIEEKITTKTKAVVAVHLYGQSANIDEISKITRNHGLYLVEDAAQAHLCEYKGKSIGGLGDVGSFSFYPGKNLGAYGEGGAVTTNDPSIAHKLKLIRDHGAEEKYHHIRYGHNYRMDGVQGAILGIKLKYLKDWTEKRRSIAQKYRGMLADVDSIVLPRQMPYTKHVYHLFVIQAEKRDSLQSELSKAGVSTGLHYPVPLHLQKCFFNLGYQPGDFPATEQLASKCLSLPIYPEMTEEEIIYVVNQIRIFYGYKII